MSEPTTIEQRIRDEKRAQEEERRANKIAGLRALADLLEQNPGLEVPIGLERHPVSLAQYKTVDDEEAKAIKASLADTAKVLTGAGVKVEKDYSNDYFTLKAELAPGVVYEIYSDREIVCEKKVVGTKTVERPVYAQIQTGSEEVEEEIVEWECGSLLGGANVPDVATESEAV